MNLAEAYRPKTWKEVAGLAKLKAKVALVQANGGIGGLAWLITGPSGTGKTTAALLLAAEVADPEFIEELDVGRLTSARLAELEATTHLYAWGRGGRAFIVNEIDGLPLSEVRQLLTTLERAGNGGLPKSSLWVFTTSESLAKFRKRSDKHEALVSRCVCLSTADAPGRAFAGRLWAVAVAEGLPVGTVQDVEALIGECGGNLRAAFAEVESGRFAESVVRA